ncbi:GTPase activating protein (GAP) for Rho1p [Pleurotus ostreatus]|nr:GTPase activating protein (GAP) for Rho1p [Pleurotus ostreatus]
MRKGPLEDPEHMHAPTKASLKAWWQSFTFAQKMKKDSESAALNKGEPVHTVFGKPLKESLKYASVQISTANANGELYVWGYIPVVVAKCGLFLKENATEVEGVFRVNGSAKRMRELQAAFETPPRYGKSLDWKQETYTPHDVASVFRRYLTQMPEPVIPHNLYHEFRDALAKIPNDHNEVISTYKRLIRSMPRANQYLLLYVLDLLSVFARKSDKNRMTATNLAVIFRPGIISHPTHEMLPNEHHLTQKVLEFLIEHQDWFMLDIPPPPQGPEVDGRGGTGAGSGGSQPNSVSRTGFGGRRPGDGGGGDGHGMLGSGSGAEVDDHDLHIIPSSDEERDHTSSEESLTPPGGSPGVDDGGLSPVAESPTGERGFGFAGALGEDGGGSRGLEKGSEKDRARVLRKQKRASSSQSRVPTTGALQIDTSHSAGR